MVQWVHKEKMIWDELIQCEGAGKAIARKLRIWGKKMEKGDGEISAWTQKRMWENEQEGK